MSFLPHTRRLVSATLAVAILVFCTGTGAMAASPVANPGAPSAADDRQGPHFYDDPVTEVTGRIDGDVYAAGQSITISGDVTGDVIAAAQTITITGTIEGNVRLAAQDVTITGDVSRSATVFAANVTVTDTGSFGNDVVGAAGNVTVNGDIGRDLFLSVGELTIGGSVGGNVSYNSDKEANIDAGAVDGTVERIAPPQPADTDTSPGAAFVGWLLGLLYALVALSIVTLLAGLVFPRWLQRVTGHLVPSPWKALLVGFVASIAVPIALLLLLVTIIGAPLALVGMLLWTVLVLASFVYSAYYIGRLVLRGARSPVLTALLGGIILIIALQIPWLNIVVWLAMVFFGLGAQLLEFHSQRPWNTRIEAGPEAPPPVQPPASRPAPATEPPQA